ncbi:MAG: S-layer homology domain-containing protein, partial [Candidatus Margulisbacteria bacterium]|nr:S-layer homology domain-containing protein [Candidatus Margulisiibacteriota bacterium]
LKNWDKYSEDNLRAPLRSKKKVPTSRTIETPRYAKASTASGVSGGTGEELLNFVPPMEAQLQKGMIYPRTASAVGVGAQPLTVISPKDLLVTTRTDIEVAGIVQNMRTVLVNGKTVQANDKGAFQTVVGLTPGKNNINIEAGDNVEARRVLRLFTYNDIAGISQKSVIEYLATLGYFSEGNSFQPSKPVARDELVSLAVKLAGLRTPAVRQASYPDVPANYWAAPSIYAAAEAGIVDLKGSFNPKQNVTRAEAINIIVKALGKSVPVTNLKTAPYNDVRIDHPYANGVAIAKALGLITGGEDFRPDAMLTRAELAVWLVKTESVKKQIIQLRDFGK